MYKVLTIGGYDYKLEYSVEASLYSEGTEKLLEFLGKTIGAAEAVKPDAVPDADKAEYYRTMLKESLGGYLSLPDVALTLFYAGLQEHHGADADGKVVSKADAKRLLAQFLKEGQDKENGATGYIGLLNLIITQMEEDGFFKLIGLEQLSQSMTGLQNRQQRRKKASGSKS